MAAAHGFRGGLVPGVAVYGYMVPAILDRLGPEWMARGGISVRFVAPCYDGDVVVSRCDGSAVTAEQENGSIYASGVVTLSPPGAPATETWAHEVYPERPQPKREERPVASPQSVVPGTLLGTLRRKLEAADQSDVPRALLHLANEILGQNFIMSPWIHAGSEVRHHCMPVVGQEIRITGKIEECFERKGRRFAVAGLSFTQDNASSQASVANVRHSFIYDLGNSRNAQP